MTAAQKFDKLFYRIPGSWAGNGPNPETPSNTANVTVSTNELDNAIHFLFRRGCRLLEAEQWPIGHPLAGGTVLRFTIPV